MAKIKIRKPDTGFSPENAAPPLEKKADETEIATNTIGAMSGASPGPWWWVWSLGKGSGGPKPAKYFLGMVPGDRLAAILEARKRYPKFIGRMQLDRADNPPSKQYLEDLNRPPCPRIKVRKPS